MLVTSLLNFPTSIHIFCSVFFFSFGFSWLNYKRISLVFNCCSQILWTQKFIHVVLLFKMLWTFHLRNVDATNNVESRSNFFMTLHEPKMSELLIHSIWIVKLHFFWIFFLFCFREKNEYRNNSISDTGKLTLEHNFFLSSRIVVVYALNTVSTIQHSSI